MIKQSMYNLKLQKSEMVLRHMRQKICTEHNSVGTARKCIKKNFYHVHSQSIMGKSHKLQIEMWGYQKINAHHPLTSKISINTMPSSHQTITIDHHATTITCLT